MISVDKLQVVKDLQNKTIRITRYFDASKEQVWRAWTEPALLDQWWAPEPWRSETKSMDFRVGGRWLYAMVGPDQTRQWCMVNYTRIEPFKVFEGDDAFCDEQGNYATDMPKMYWTTSLDKADNGTLVTVDVRFDSDADLQKIVEMGFEQGFTTGLDQLEKLLKKTA